MSTRTQRDSPEVLRFLSRNKFAKQLVTVIILLIGFCLVL